MIYYTGATGVNIQYQWKKDEVEIEGATRDSLVISSVSMSDTGYYYCEISDVCTVVTDKVFLTVENCTGIDQVIKKDMVHLYPNPFTHYTTIEFPNPNFEEYQLIVTDISGKVARIIDNVTNSMIELERDNLSRGFYLIELRGDKIYRGKILIE